MIVDGVQNNFWSDLVLRAGYATPDDHFCDYLPFFMFNSGLEVKPKSVVRVSLCLRISRKNK